MEIIDITPENIDKEHICCAISNSKNDDTASVKKNWMKQNYKDGLVFKRLNARGKAFIEYIPVENAWNPIAAKGYMFINCLWVSGQFKQKGIAGKLLDECIKDAKSKGKKGLVINSSDKKRPFLSDPDFLRYKGFIECDSAEPYYKLYCLPFDNKQPKAKYKDNAKKGEIKDKGLTLIYTNQCPFSQKYAMMMLETAKKNGEKLKLIKIETKKDAQAAPVAFTTYAFFNNGKLYSNEILSMQKFEKFLEIMKK